MSDYTNNKAAWEDIKNETQAGANTASRVGGAAVETVELIGEASGWGNYQDTQYTDVAPFTLASNIDTVLPNNKGSVIETQLPVDVATFTMAQQFKALTVMV